MDDIKWTNLYKALNEYADYWISTAHRIMKENDNIATGQLSTTMGIEREISFSNDILSVKINIEPYWKYLDKGTKPHMPPVDAIAKWVEVKINPPEVNNLAWAIATKIKKEGTKPHPFFDKATEEAWKYFEVKVADAIQEDIAEWINNVILNDLDNIL